MTNVTDKGKLPRVPLYQRLPEIYRIKDSEQQPPGQLERYLGLVEGVYDEIFKNIETLYHDLFIETCAPWVIPYIGDLLGNSYLKGEERTIRLDVADAIALRRRKGTIASIERLTYNLTAWGVHCVELRENLLWNQHLNHQRPDKGGHPPYAHVFDIKLQSLEDFKDNIGVRAWAVVTDITSPIGTKFYSGRIKAVRGQAVVIQNEEKQATIDYDDILRAGGVSVSRFTPVRGGTLPLRDPALLSLLESPFDPFAHTVDVKPPGWATIRYNLPNLAIFLWRLKDYPVNVSKPSPPLPPLDPTDPPVPAVNPIGGAVAPQANVAVRFNIHPMGQPLRLFNTYQFKPDRTPPLVTQLDQIPGPIPMARLSGDSEAGAPSNYVAVDTYDPTTSNGSDIDIAEVGIQFHLPASTFDAQGWAIRGANLCAWETGLPYPLNNREIAIDPILGRALFGVYDTAEANTLAAQLLTTHTYGAVGPVGAHPISRDDYPKTWKDEPINYKKINWHTDPDPNKKGLQNAFDNLHNSAHPVVIEITDSMTHDLNIADGTLTGPIVEDGGSNIRLNKSLIIRAATGQRPVIRLACPLRFRPTHVEGSDATQQAQYDTGMDNLLVRLEGLYITRGPSFQNGDPLVARAAVNSLEILDCTLDPGGYQRADQTRAPIHTSIHFRKNYGFDTSSEEAAFNQIPEITVKRSITGPLEMDPPYTLILKESIIDSGEVLLFSLQPGGSSTLETDLNNHIFTAELQQAFTDSWVSLVPGGPLTVDGENPLWEVDDGRNFYIIEKDGPTFNVYGTHVSLSGSGGSAGSWGPPTQVDGVTFFGRVRVESLWGKGGIWEESLEVFDNQKGCIKFSYFSGKGDRLPQNHGCVNGNNATLHFVSRIFGQPQYGQLRHTSDFRIRERGPDDDAMGAFGFLKEAHKWRNLTIRFREFMPVGVRPLLIPVT